MSLICDPEDFHRQVGFRLLMFDVEQRRRRRDVDTAVEVASRRIGLRSKELRLTIKGVEAGIPLNPIFVDRIRAEFSRLASA